MDMVLPEPAAVLSPSHIPAPSIFSRMLGGMYYYYSLSAGEEPKEERVEYLVQEHTSFKSWRGVGNLG